MPGYKEAYELMEQIYENFSDEDKEWFVNEDPVMMHLTLGMHIRNHAGLWSVPHEPEIVDGVDISENHPDAISSKVIKDFQNTIKLENVK